jgi:peptide/nickel transport system substrate-binding protein
MMWVMNRVMAILVCVGMLLPASLVLPGVVKNAEAAAPIQFIVGFPQTVDNLNPLVGLNNIDYESYILQFDFLNRFDKDYNPIPAAAESWSHSEDGLVWIFNIRHGMTFHDNVPVTAADVNWTFNLMLNDPNAGSLYVDLLRNITDIRALDDYTIQMTCSAPKANMLGLMIPILPMHLWSAIPANKLTSVDLWDANLFPNGPIGSGPFRLQEYVVDSYIRYTPWPGYYGGTVHFDELLFKIYVNSDVMLADLIGGYIDLATMVPKNDWYTTLGDPHIDGQAAPELVLHELGFNVCPPELRVGHASNNYETLNRSVRRAVEMAINKTEIVEDSYSGLGVPGDVLIPPASKTYHYNLTPAEEVKFDIPAANALLNASGYIDSDGDGIRENSTNGAKLSFNYLYASEYKEDENAALKISRWLSDIGIEATPQGELESQLYVDWIGMKYDMFMWNWGTDVDPTFILSVMTTAQIPTSHNDWSAWSDCFYSNPYYDELFMKQQITPNITARQQIVYEMQRILYNDTPYVVLAYPYGLYAYRDDKFTNWPVITSDAMGPFSGTAGSPWFYYQILPIGANLPPTDVSAGEDTNVALNETRAFTGSGYDPDGDNLTWTWEFTEPNGTVNTLTGQSVSYTFLNEGNVTVKLSVSDGVNPAVTDQIVITVAIIANAGQLVGYVTNTQDVALVGATVSVPGTSTTTNASGYYEMILTADSYTVTAVAQGYESASETAVVEEGQETMLNFTLASASGSLRGHVYDSKTGDALSNVTVSARVGDVTRAAVSDESGAYEILLVPVGTCNVTAARQAYVANSTSVEIVAGEELVLDIELTPTSAGAGGLSTAAWATIGIVVVVVVIAAVALLLRRRKKGEEPSPPRAEPPKT